MKLKKFNWQSLKRYMDPKAVDDMNIFLEKLPQNTNKTLLIITGVVWVSAAGLGLFTTVKIQEFSELSSQREESAALVPSVPQIKDKAVSPQEVASFVEELQETYKGLEIKGNSSNIVIRAKSTAQFGEFREAIGHVQNGGSGWRVNVDKLCIGKECKQFPLAVALKINRISVD
ncbi:MAG: hypothetical protein OEY94_03995 [Alphaproteobacteria bacterium]|nr:hypothetical protein [Alphaproteobacteria bacterium]